MYIKFKKNHPAGINKGECRQVSNDNAVEFVGGKYASECSEEEYGEWKEEYLANEKLESEKLIKDFESRNADRYDGSGEQQPEVEEAPAADDVDSDTKYHTLTEDDLTMFPEQTKGLKVGDEVEKNEDDALLTGDDGLFITMGNVEASQGNGRGESVD